MGNAPDVLIGGTNFGPHDVKDTLTGNAGADQFRVDIKIVIIWVNGKQLAIPTPEDTLTDFDAGGGDSKF